MPTPRAPDVFSLCHLQSFQLFGFPPRTKFFHFVQNSGPEFRDKHCERWKRHSSPPKFPPNKFSPEQYETTYRQARERTPVTLSSILRRICYGRLNITARAA